MKKTLASLLAVSALALSMALSGQTKKTVTDYLGLPGPIVFDGKAYQLGWTSHPTNNYYKQEYIVAGDNLNQFNTMIMVELLTGDTKPKDAATAKMTELKKMKAANPVVNYEWFENKKTGEYMIDFLLSQNAADGKSIGIVERNVYRYLPFKGADGTQGIVLFAVSTRSYGNKINGFLTSLKTTKSDLVNKAAAYKIGELKIVK
ncbi:MAG TPA: hypothetical protein VJU78_07680 [Chitinophagaceae bacterium]|nr:hypothetical protein [Chitinophagaceae bacterium]